MKKYVLLIISINISLLLSGHNIAFSINQDIITLNAIGSSGVLESKHQPINDEFIESSQDALDSYVSMNPKVIQEYYERLFYTCKVWGFVKYFHSETANCSINLDSILIQKLPGIAAADSDEEFNQVLLELINSPGETALPIIPLPEIPDSLMFNLNLEWMQDDVFSQNVKAALDTIQVRFRPRPHCLVGEAFSNGNPTFADDILYNSNSGLFPNDSRRILTLFRYWNIINYFYPYKNILDQDWDSTLTELIPLFVEATNAIEYNKAILILANRIDDSHAYTSGGVLSSIYGTFYPHFAFGFFENETVIYKVDSSITEVKPGDIVKYIDGVEIGNLRDSLMVFSWGSNDLAVAFNMHNNLLNGPYGGFNITVENEDGTFDYTLQRNWNSNQLNAFLQNTGPVWLDSIVNESCHFGYVDMSRLNTGQIPSMMEDLWNTDAIIFDIRSYPQGTLWSLVNYLFTSPINIANFTTPDIQYPGVLSWFNEFIGGYHPDVYEGQLIILFDIRTISQAEYTCMGLEQHPGSIKIGSQTKAADGNVSLIYLPGSLTCYFTGLGTFYPDYTPTQRVGIIPDFEIYQSIEGLSQGKDDVLEYAFNCDLVGSKSLINTQTVAIVYPNPFTTSATIEYELTKPSTVQLTIYDYLGKQIKVIEKKQAQGKQQIIWNAEGLPAGVYFCVIKTNKGTNTTKLIKL